MIFTITLANQKGFTLVEMAMVLLIVSLLLGGLIPTVSGQIERQHVSDTRKQLDEIQQALIGFAIVNGRLPCPADSIIATGQPGAGVEKGACGAGANGGVLPWVTLGVSETDSWGRRFTYRVTPDFADPIGAATYGGCVPSPTPTQSSFALCSSGNLNVGLTAGASNVASNVPAVIVSHGINGLGAYLPSGQQVTPVPAAATDEGDNADNDNNFVSHDFVQNGFDDIVIWISPNVLINRMVAAGKLP